MKKYFLMLMLLALIPATSVFLFASAGQKGQYLLEKTEWLGISLGGNNHSATTISKSNGSGINVGFDIIYDNFSSLPTGQNSVAAYIFNDGVGGLSLCAGTLNNSTFTCNFVFGYSIGGVEQLSLPNSGVYDAWSGACGGNSPLTIQGCFNENSFGQVFKPSVSGLLTEFTIDMTFLNESGGVIDNLIFFIYEIDADNQRLGNLLQSVTLDLTDVPFQTDWTNYVFTADDFHTISIPFSEIMLDSDTFYGVFPGGEYVPGDLPNEDIGEPVPVPLSGTTLYLIILLMVGTMGFLYRKMAFR